MRFEITGKDLKTIDDSLDEFISEFEIGYKESLEKAVQSRKAKMFGLSGRIRNLMPEEIAHIHFIEGDKVILENSLPDSSLARRAGMYKKIKEGLRGYLKYKGFDCDVKVVKHEVK